MEHMRARAAEVSSSLDCSVRRNDLHMEGEVRGHGRQQTGERLASLETSMYSLIGNGQPGRMGSLEQDVRKLQQWRKYLLGYVAGGSVVIGGIISFVAWLLKGEAE